MGSDIHVYIEYRHKSWNLANWCNFGGTFNLGRRYAIFARLAGVRDFEDVDHIAPRGLPKMLSHDTRYAYEDWQGDTHDASWLTLEEWEHALSDIEDLEYETVAAIMRFYKSEGFETRVVFWFDS